MSRSNNTELKNPATRFFKWEGSQGRIVYYDKENKENVEVPTPFTFLVLDRLTTISGYSDADQSGLWSNEIRNTKTDILTVRSKAGVKAEGLYDEVKHVPGAKYAQSLYVAFYDENKQLVIGNFKLNGCAVSAWIEFCKGKDIFKGAIRISGAEKGKKGATVFYSPVFDYQPAVSEKSEEAAKELDRQLQEYLASYFALRGQAQTSVAVAAGVGEFTGGAVEEDYRTARDREMQEYDVDPFTKNEEDEDDGILF